MKPGRNDKCSCGSGLKFKKCCLGSQNSSVSSEVCTPITSLYNTNQLDTYVPHFLPKNYRLRFIQIYFNIRLSELTQSCRLTKEEDPFHALQLINFGLSNKTTAEAAKILSAFHANEKKWLAASEFVFVTLSKSPEQNLQFPQSSFAQNSPISNHVSKDLVSASNDIQQSISKETSFS